MTLYTSSIKAYLACSDFLHLCSENSSCTCVVQIQSSNCLLYISMPAFWEKCTKLQRSRRKRHHPLSKRHNGTIRWASIVRRSVRKSSTTNVKQQQTKEEHRVQWQKEAKASDTAKTTKSEWRGIDEKNAVRIKDEKRRPWQRKTKLSKQRHGADRGNSAYREVLTEAKAFTERR